MELFEKVFGQFHNRLKVEGVLKAVLLGLIAGTSTAIVTAFILFFTSYNAIWIAVVVGILVGLIVGIPTYFVRLRPTEKDVARRVDLQGLKERLITMVEHKDDTSFMATKQRADAMEELVRVQSIKLPLVISKGILISAIVLCVVMILVVTLVGVSLSGYLPSIDDIVSPDDIGTVNLSYRNGEGGFLIGDVKQVINDGKVATEVVAVANTGYMFDRWSDGVLTPNRVDNKAKASIDVIAIFVPIDEDMNDGFMPDKNAPDPDFDEGKMEGDKPDNMPGAAGKYEEYNQVIDGETYYRDVLKEYYEKARDILSKGGVVPDYMKIIIEEYFKVIE